MNYTGVSVFSKAKQGDKNYAREKCVEENMKQAHLRFALGLEKAKAYELTKEYEQEQHRIAGVKRQIEIQQHVGSVDRKIERTRERTIER